MSYHDICGSLSLGESNVYDLYQQDYPTGHSAKGFCLAVLAVNSFFYLLQTCTSSFHSFFFLSGPQKGFNFFTQQVICNNSLVTRRREGSRRGGRAGGGCYLNLHLLQFSHSTEELNHLSTIFEWQFDIFITSNTYSTFTLSNYLQSCVTCCMQGSFYLGWGVPLLSLSILPWGFLLCTRYIINLIPLHLPLH